MKGDWRKRIRLFCSPADPMLKALSPFKCDLREGNLPDNLNVHSLVVHTNASMPIAQGVDVRTVAGLLGHAQPSNIAG